MCLGLRYGPACQPQRGMKRKWKRRKASSNSPWMPITGYKNNITHVTQKTRKKRSRCPNDESRSVFSRSFRHFGQNSSNSQCELQDSKTGRHPPNPKPGRNFAHATWWVQEWVSPRISQCNILASSALAEDLIAQTWNPNHRMQKTEQNETTWPKIQKKKKTGAQMICPGVLTFCRVFLNFGMPITECTKRVEPT